MSVKAGERKALRAALRLVFPAVPIQLCWAYKLCNIADKAARGKTVAWRRLRPSTARPIAPRLNKPSVNGNCPGKRCGPKTCIEGDLDCSLNFFAIPEGHWENTHTTNVI